MKTTCKLLVCDLDNTLLKGPRTTSWQLIWDFLGGDKETRSFGYRQYNEGAFSYADWCAHDARTFRSFELKEEHFPEICRDLRPAPRLRETLSVLRKRGTRMAIVSGALDLILHTALPWHGEFFEHVFVNGARFCAQGIINDIIPTPYDFEGKLACVKQLCGDHAIPMEETVFIGDGPNDLSVAGEVGLSIAFGSDCDEVREKFDLDLPGDDFSRILDYLE